MGIEVKVDVGVAEGGAVAGRKAVTEVWMLRFDSGSRQG